MPYVTGLITTFVLNTNATDMEHKIPDINNLAKEAALNKKATEIETKIPNTTGFITTREFNRLIKISFAATMKEAAKSLASTSQVYNALDMADENREKNRKTSDVCFKLFYW